MTSRVDGGYAKVGTHSTRLSGYPCDPVEWVSTIVGNWITSRLDSRVLCSISSSSVICRLGMLRRPLFLLLLSSLCSLFFPRCHALPLQHPRTLPRLGCSYTSHHPMLSSIHPTRLHASRLSDFVSWYDLTIHRYPLTTKMITGGVIGGIGDALVQLIESKEKKLDLRRLYIFTMVSILYFAPFIHFWFGFLESIQFASHRSTLYKATIMMLIDQVIGAVVLKSGFFYSFAFVDQITPPFHSSKKSFIQEANDLVKTKLWPTLKANWSKQSSYCSYLF